MLVADSLHPPIQYDRIWFIIGCLLILTIPLWYGVLLWITRHKQIKSLADLTPIPTGAELNALKAKYLRIIEEIYQSYQRKEITVRSLHGDLSITVRYFVFEAKQFPAPTMTLSDLALAPYPNLTKLIAQYYPDEFAAITTGPAPTAVDAAKGFIQQWT
jgi:hypothetical protein